ncbi:MAG: 16S rRNA processing protein RimM [Bacteroidaceae bacterium]|nr:16S rRNA processing protein RimM [Bacteroidaceae bacterium]
MIRQEDVYQIGRMGKVHGLKGEINFQFTDDVWDRTDSDYIICEVDGILVPFFIEEYRFRSDSTAIMKLEGIDTVDAAQMLVNCYVYFEKKYQEELDEDEVSLNYFIGFKMIDGDNGEDIGIIADIDDKTDNWLFVVERKDGSEVMIPAHEEFISEINKEEKKMVMDLPLGLLDL